MGATIGKSLQVLPLRDFCRRAHVFAPCWLGGCTTNAAPCRLANRTHSHAAGSAVLARPASMRDCSVMASRAAPGSPAFDRATAALLDAACALRDDLAYQAKVSGSQTNFPAAQQLIPWPLDGRHHIGRRSCIIAGGRMHGSSDCGQGPGHGPLADHSSYSGSRGHPRRGRTRSCQPCISFDVHCDQERNCHYDNHRALTATCCFGNDVPRRWNRAPVGSCFLQPYQQSRHNRSRRN